MTTLIRQNKDWLEEQLSEAIGDYLESYRDIIIEDISRCVIGQIFSDSIFSHSKIKSNQCGKLVIEIDIPDPETCKEFVNSPHFDAYEYMERFFKQ